MVSFYQFDRKETILVAKSNEDSVEFEGSMLIDEKEFRDVSRHEIIEKMLDR